MEEAVEIAYFLEGGLLLGGSNAEKWGDHQKKKFLISNFVEALIQFKEKNKGSLKLHVLLGRERR